MADAIRVFVGCAANHEDAESQAVIEWSIRKHASRPVEITWMRLSKDPASPFYSDGKHGWQTAAWATPFSGFRWAVPALCGYKGKAVYTDSDVIFMADVAELADQQHPEGSMLLGRGSGQPRICVSLWDCEAAKTHIPDIPTLMANPSQHRECLDIVRRPGVVAPFEGEWNCLDKELGGRSVHDKSIKALHYTDMRSQPQLRHAVPRLAANGRKHWFDGVTTPNKYPQINALFDELLAEAKINGYGPERYMDAPLFGPYTKRGFR